MHDAIHSMSKSHRKPRTSHFVDNTDWLKTAAIILAAFAFLVSALLVVLSIAAAGRMRLLACFAAVVIYIWQEQSEYSFPQIHFAAFIFGIGVWSANLSLFLRGPSRIQPHKPARILKRHFRLTPKADVRS